MSGRSFQVGVGIGAGALLLALALQIVLGARLSSATFDETTHLPAGFAYVKTGDFRLNPQHPPLVKLLAGLPLLAIGAELDPEDPALAADPPDEWGFGYRFLYGQDADRLLLWGRLPIAMLALLMAAYVFVWARELHGDGAALLALGLCALSPTVIAHARFVTMDVPLACFSTIGAYHLWRRLKGGRAVHAVGAGLGVGMAMAAKYSGLVALAATLALIAFGVAVSGRRATLADRLARGLRTVAVVAVLAVIVVQASYFFSTDVLVYWKGLAAVQADHDPDYAYYLLGQFRPGGFWHYFIVAFLLKTPLPTLILSVASVVLAVRSSRGAALDELCLVLPIVAWFAATSLLADNLGVRYLLPVYPLLFVFVSRLAPWVAGRRWPAVALAALLAWYAGSALWIYPDQLAYFNELVGGPANGHRALDDSNIDWSQDLKRLAAWLDGHDAGTIKLHYGRNIAPDYYGIAAVPLTNEEWAGDPAPGTYAIGTHLLIRGKYYATLDPRLKTDWLERFEPTARVGYSIWLFEID